jgi:glycine/D-amino acid oxidase-like deaminating enzyme
VERDLAAVRVQWSGGLLWDLPPDKLEAFAVEHESWGYGVRLVDRAEAQRIEPHLAAPPDVAVHVAAEGAVEPFETTLALLAAAKDLGATIIAHTPARAIESRAGRVAGVRTDAGHLAAEVVVVAAGAGTAGLMASAGLRLPIGDRANLFIQTAPQDALLNGLVMAPAMHLRQTRDGRIVAAAGIGGREPAEAAQALLGTLQGMLRSDARLSLASHALARRPIPGDGLPIVGPAAGIDGLYVGVAHSGVTLAPAIGRLAAREIVTGQREALLAPYGPDRFRGVAPSPRVA